MRIMTFDALHSGVVCFWINAGDTFPLACRIGQIGVAAHAKLPAAVDIQFFRFFRMVHRRPVAIFTWYYTVKLFSADLDNRSMAGTAVFMHSLAA